MADTDTNTTIKYISLENLQLYDTLLKDKMSEEDAKSLKTVALSTDRKKLLFYRVSEPVGSTVPAYEIELPETDLTGVMAKVVNAVDGDIGIFQGGTIVDSGVKLSDLATEEYVDTKVAEGIAGALSLSKQIVTTVPTAAEAKDNVIYLIKDLTATGSDKYKEYTLISGEVVMIGDTSTDLSGYYTKEEAQAIVDAAKSEAIESATETAAEDATAKADKALADSKAYTDTEVGKVSTTVSANTASIGTLETNVTTINNTLTTHGDKITALESQIADIETATAEDIQALFA